MDTGISDQARVPPYAVRAMVGEEIVPLDPDDRTERNAAELRTPSFAVTAMTSRRCGRRRIEPGPAPAPPGYFRSKVGRASHV